MVLVVGATGLVGMEVCRQLLSRGERVRALIRSSSAPEKVSSLKAWGAELCEGDLKDPDTLIAACSGVEAIISTASSTFSRQTGDSIETVDSRGQLNLVDAAVAAQIKRFVFVSFRHPAGKSFPLAEAKAQVEDALTALNFTIIQASFFMESWLSPALGFDYTHATARIYGEGTNAVSWVSFRDVAGMCVLSLRHPSAERRTIEFGGPASLTPLQVVALFERLGSKPFHLEHIPEDVLLAQFNGATDPLQKSLAALMLGFSQGDAIAMEAIQQHFGLTLTSVEDYARQVLNGSVVV